MAHKCLKWGDFECEFQGFQVKTMPMEISMHLKMHFNGDCSIDRLQRKYFILLWYF